MNSDAIESAVTKAVAMALTALATRYWPDNPDASLIPTIAAGAGALAAFAWGLYRHYNMVKVPQKN